MTPFVNRLIAFRQKGHAAIVIASFFDRAALNCPIEQFG